MRTLIVATLCEPRCILSSLQTSTMFRGAVWTPTTGTPPELQCIISSLQLSSVLIESLRINSGGYLISSLH